MKRKIVRILLTQVVLMSCLSLGWTQQDTDTSQSPPPDNTKVNQRDRNQSAPTADQQKENPADRQLVQQIRRALGKDKSLSTNAHNVKVIAQGGMVTLRGPVNSESEKQAVETKAAQIAGADCLIRNSPAQDSLAPNIRDHLTANHRFLNYNQQKLRPSN